MINLIKQSNNTQEVRFNNKILGHFIMQEDGYYLFFSLDNFGGWDGYSLKQIANKLDGVNNTFDKEIDLYFDELRHDFKERAKVEYRKVLNETGFFFEWYPQLFGEYKKDKAEWLNIFKEMEESINKF